MNELKVFENVEFGKVRTVEVGGKVLFCGSDVAKALGYARPSDAISTHCKGTAKHSIGVETGLKADGEKAIQKIEMLFIPEGDIYRLIVRSKLPSAEKFEIWVFDEVLPSIRQTGGYVANDDLFIENYLPFADENTKLLFKSTLAVVKNQNELISTQQKEIEEKSQIIVEYEPKVSYYDKVLQSQTAENITVIAKDYGMSGKQMNKKLHTLGIQYKMGDTWLLYQKYAEMGYTKSKTYSYEDDKGNKQSKFSTKWTQKGRLFIYDLLKQDGILPLMEIEN